MTDGQAFDYVVVGAGASGAVVANRLSANPQNRVLLLESGGLDTNPLIADIGGVPQLWGSDVDWKLTTESQPGLNGRQMLINQGRVLGGSTSIHAMMYVRGNRRDFDGWRDVGNEGWGFDDVLPYFKRLEDYEGAGASEYHGTGGPLSVRDCPDPPARSEAFMAGAMELGYDGHWDINGARQENGAGLIHFTVTKDGKRASAASAFLAPIADRRNLTVRTHADVTRILFEGKRAVGVEYRIDGRLVEARAEREVIVSGGAFLSPKLLMLSGLGPADHLRANGIEAVVDLPGVGQNLQDHMQLPIAYQLKKNLPNPLLLTGNALFVRIRSARYDGRPDLQLNFTPAVPAPLAPILNLPVPACIFLPIMVHPDSIGSVRLRSNNPLDAPVLNPNYLQRDSDVDVFFGAIELIRSLAATKPMAELYGGELAPMPASKAEVEKVIRAQASTLWHPAGTCKMGRDSQAVVDPRLRVYGIERLRVVDASVMPTVISGNTQAACFMIGERGAEMILADNA